MQITLKRTLIFILTLCLIGIAAPIFATGIIYESGGFVDGMAYVTDGSINGFIDKTGKMVITLNEESAWWGNRYFFSEGLASFDEDDKIGFIDTSGNIVIPAKFNSSQTSYFSEGLALIREDGLYGYIDKTGEYVIPPQYKNAEDFHDGLALVGDDYDDHKFIDTTGKIVLQPEYQTVRSFSDGLALVGDRVTTGYVKKMQYGYIDKTGELVIPLMYDREGYDDGDFQEGFAAVKLNGKNVIIDKKGEVILTLEEYSYVGSFSEGLAPVRSGDYQTGKCGYVDINGKLAIPLEYDAAENFSSGYAPVKKDGKYGYIDKTGKVIIPFEYDDVDSFGDGLAWVRKYPKYGFIDTASNIVVPIKYDWASSFNEGLARVEEIKYRGYDSYLGYIDNTGKVVLPIEYYGELDFHEGLAWVRLGYNEFAYIDKTGNIVIRLEGYDHYASNFSQGLAPVKKDGKFGFIDTSGKVVIPLEYDDVNYTSFLSNGLARVWKNNKVGFIDKTGKVVIPLEYDGAYNVYSDNLIGVIKNGKYGFVDATGKTVIPLEYEWAYCFIDGLACVKKDGKYGFIDKTQKVVIPFEYDTLGDHVISEDRVIMKKDNKSYLVGTNVSIPLEYNVVDSFNEGLVIVEKDGKYGFMDNMGKLIVSIQYDFATSFNDGYSAVNKEGKWIALKNPLSDEKIIPSSPANATPTSSTVLVNGEKVSFDAYNIDESNYFKLRDLAYTLSGTQKQFEVAWDASANSISLTSGKQYTVAGGEMTGKGTGTKTANSTTSKILLDGKEIQLTAYNIEGNNYFKLRDIGIAFDFNVSWDGENNTIIINTKESYSEEN